MVQLRDQYIYEIKKFEDNIRYAQSLPPKFMHGHLIEENLDRFFSVELEGYIENETILMIVSYKQHIEHFFSYLLKEMEFIKKYIGKINQEITKTTGEYLAVAREIGTSLAALKFLLGKISTKDIIEDFDFITISEKTMEIVFSMYEVSTHNKSDSLDHENNLDQRNRIYNRKNDTSKENMTQIETGKGGNFYKIISILSTISIFLLFIGIFDLPYSFYSILRLVVFITSITITVFYNSELMNKKLSYISLIMAIVFNPFIPLHSVKEIWILIDLLGIIIMSYFKYDMYIQIKK